MFSSVVEAVLGVPQLVSSLPFSLALAAEDSLFAFGVCDDPGSTLGCPNRRRTEQQFTRTQSNPEPSELGLHRTRSHYALRTASCTGLRGMQCAWIKFI